MKLPLRTALLSPLAMLSGCTAVIDQASFFPQSVEAPQAVLRAPAGYAMQDAMLELPWLGRLHAVRLDNPASETTIIYSGGNGSYVSAGTEDAAALARATGADLVFYDYPGRGGTTVPPTLDAAIATGPALLRALRERGWIGRGPVFAYGLSFGGSQAAAMAREGGFAGIILEGTAADIAAVGRNFVPGIARPFVKLSVDPALQRFDYLGYAAAARAPVLLISTKKDDIVRERNMSDFAEQLKQRGLEVTFASVPGRHGDALLQPAALTAIRDCVSRKSAN
jgi:pimeloyl-ACP methyl ester carboxylesterase